MLKKKTSELIEGDIILVEYGDYDNWVRAVVNYVEKTKNNRIKINCHYMNKSENFDMYGGDCLEEVIGNVND